MSAVNGSISINAGSITNQHISGAAADIIQASKLQHAYKAATNFLLPIGGTPVSAEYVVYTATGSGTVTLFQACLVAVGSTSNMSFDLLKNGTTVLTTPIVITNGNTNRQVLDGTITVTSFVDEDVFSIKLIMTTNTGAQGPFAQATFVELTSPA